MDKEKIVFKRRPYPRNTKKTYKVTANGMVSIGVQHKNKKCKVKTLEDGILILFTTRKAS